MRRRGKAGGGTGKWLLGWAGAALLLWAGNPGLAQVPAAPAPVPEEEGGMTAEQIEMQKKLGAATAAAQKDPAIQAAYQKLAKTMRELDDLLYGKIKQIDPSLKDYVDKLMKAKYPDGGQGK